MSYSISFGDAYMFYYLQVQDVSLAIIAISKKYIVRVDRCDVDQSKYKKRKEECL